MSRAEQFDRLDFDLDDDEEGEAKEAVVVVSAPTMQQELSVLADRKAPWMWPIDPRLITRVGDSVMARRPGKNRPHEGLDIFAPAGTRVYSASGGRVLRIRDGRAAKQAKSRRAGLFVDVLSGPDAQGTQYIQRYLHLASVRDLDKSPLAINTPLAELASAYTSGVAQDPHLHFEVRAVNANGSYGPPLDPRRFLPPLSIA
jgi:murein DD-endopeptidase MepM/ murein hydrolase activator NlpD